MKKLLNKKQVILTCLVVVIILAITAVIANIFINKNYEIARLTSLVASKEEQMNNLRNDPEHKRVAKGMCMADAEALFTKAMDAKKLQPTTIENGAPVTYYSLQDWNAADKERKDAQQNCEQKYGK